MGDSPEPDAAPLSTQLSRLDRRPINVSIAPSTILVVFGIVATVWVIQALSSTLLIFAGAMLLATAMDWPATQMSARGIPRSVAVLLMFLVVIGLLSSVVWLLVPVIAHETEALNSQLPDYQSSIQHLLRRFGIHRNVQSGLSIEHLTTEINANLSTIANRLTSITLEVGHAAVVTFAMLVIAFMLAMDPMAGTRFTRRFLSPAASERLGRITADVDSRIGGWIRGQVLVAATFGLAFGLGCWAIGLPYAASLGLTAGVLEIIPYLGGAITVVLATLLALTIGVPQTIAVLVLYVVLINIESHILAPKFIGQAVGLPSVVVLAALFIGLETDGIVGVLLAVPLVLVAAAVVDEFWPARQANGTKVGASRSRQPPGIMARLWRRIRGSLGQSRA